MNFLAQCFFGNRVFVRYKTEIAFNCLNRDDIPLGRSKFEFEQDLASLYRPAR